VKRLGRAIEAVLFAPFDLLDWLTVRVWQRWLKALLLDLAEAGAWLVVIACVLVGWFSIGTDIAPNPPSVSGNTARDWLLLLWLIGGVAALVYIADRRGGREREERDRLRAEAREQALDDVLRRWDGESDGEWEKRVLDRAREVQRAWEERLWW